MTIPNTEVPNTIAALGQNVNSHFRQSDLYAVGICFVYVKWKMENEK